MDDLFKILPELLKLLPDSPEVRRAVVFGAWKKAAGEGLEVHTSPFEMKDRRLVIRVRDKIWKRHLDSMSAQLLFRLNSILKSSVVGVLEFRVDEDAFGSHKSANDSKIHHANVKELPLPEGLIKKAELIADPQLRRRFLESASTYLTMQELYGRK